MGKVGLFLLHCQAGEHVGDDTLRLIKVQVGLFPICPIRRREFRAESGVAVEDDPRTLPE
jgi:hypothetical protein